MSKGGGKAEVFAAQEVGALSLLHNCFSIYWRCYHSAERVLFNVHK